MRPESKVIKAGRRKITISKPRKVLYPDTGLTKVDIIRYYRDVSEYILPHLKDRPLSLHRFPDGIKEKDFFQKQKPEYLPDWIDWKKLKKKGGGSTEYILCQNVETLVYLANQTCLALHVWLSTTDKPEHPDRLIFDLDPSGEDFDTVRFAATGLYEFLTQQLKITPFVKTTGSRGVHVVIPLDRSAKFDEVRDLAGGIAELVAGENRDKITTEIYKDKRRNRLFLDIARNAYAQTAVVAYSLRALPGAPIATPITWEELWDKKMLSQKYTIKNIKKRLASKTDPWKNINRHAISIKKAKSRLDAFLKSGK